MNLQELAVVVPPLLLAVTFHEAMHGYVAYRLGDPTAKYMGRLTLNPLAHIDPFGTILIPGLLFLTNAPFLFGWAKPVPVNFGRLRNPKNDMAWVALSGPLTNLTLAAVSALLYRLLLLAGAPGEGPFSIVSFFVYMAEFSVRFNVLLAIFNLIPVPPLDGGRILVGVLPRDQAEAVARVEPFGMYVLVILIFLNPFGIMGIVWGTISVVSRAFLG
ncbi:MAG: site-2 protease family protein [bacterium]